MILWILVIMPQNIETLIAEQETTQLHKKDNYTIKQVCVEALILPKVALCHNLGLDAILIHALMEIPISKSH